MPLNKIIKHIPLLGLLAFVLSLNCSTVKAQYLYDIGFGGGMSGYTGEVSNTPFVNPGFVVEAFYRYNFNSRFAVRIGVDYGKVGGDTQDVPQTFPAAQGICDLDFLTQFVNGELLLEVNFFPYPFQKKVMNSSDITPFSFVGLGMNSYKPIEGAGLVYGSDVSGTTISIPFGVGFKWLFSEHWGLQWQFKAVKMFVDDFDCYQLDNPYQSSISGLHQKDWLYTSTVMLTYSFGEDIWDCNCPGGYKRKSKR